MSPKTRIIIGLVVPFLSVIPTVPLLDRLAVAPFGVPLGLLWLFATIPLTAACLAVCWFGYDRHRPEEHIDTNYDTGEPR